MLTADDLNYNTETVTNVPVRFLVSSINVVYLYNRHDLFKKFIKVRLHPRLNLIYNFHVITGLDLEIL